jgi:Lamin Tail Domain/CHU_C Type IX secretion signal domain
MKYLLILTLSVISATVIKAQPAERYEIVINEIFADPSPPVGLPNAEFIELKNISARQINLNGFKISDGTSTATINVNYNLQPDSLVIICGTTNAALFAAFGSTLGVSSFPSLDNSEDLLTLRSKENKLISAVNYTVKWHNNSLKADGGWSLELVNAKQACIANNNWKSSVDDKGGTPGKNNSVTALINYTTPLSVLRAFAIDSVTVQLLFTATTDSIKAANTNNYNISNGIGKPQAAIAQAPLFNAVNLTLSTPLQKGKTYLVTVNNVTDCINNVVGNYNNAKVGISFNTDSLDAVINEILFNPKPNGTDYIELYNRSNKILNLKNLYIATRNTSGVIVSIKQLSTENICFFPGSYIAVTEDANALGKAYLLKDEGAVVAISTMPSYADDKGTIVLLNQQGNVVDELTYDEAWHFNLIDNKEGVALERIDFNATTQNNYNWHSAAASAGYGTPGYQNSQFKMDAFSNATVNIEPKIFSPDNDGFDDVATITYQFDEPGYVCNITVYDAAGKLVKNIVKNSLCGLKGNFRWDGLSEQQTKLPTGIYVVVADVFNASGKTKKYKQAVTLARKL